jgi:hypothetical protein
MSVREHESISWPIGGGQPDEADVNRLVGQAPMGHRRNWRFVSWARPRLEHSPSALVAARQPQLDVAAKATATGFRPGGNLIL